MAKGHENLIPLNKRTKEMQREIQSMGGKARAEKHRRDATFRELINDILAEDGGTYDGKPITKKQYIVIKALKYMLDEELDLDAREFVKFFEMVRDTIGEKPTEHVDMTVQNSEKLDDIFSQLGGDGLEE